MCMRDEALEDLRKIKPNAHKRRPYKDSVYMGLESRPGALMSRLRKNALRD